MTGYCLVLAVWMTGGPGCASCEQGAAPTVAAPTYYSDGGYYSGGAEAPPPLRYRLRRLFGLEPQPGSYQPAYYEEQVMPGPMMAMPAVSAEPPRAVPVTSAEPPQTIRQASVPVRDRKPATVTVQRPTFPVSKKDEDRLGHESDYSWITGNLFYVRGDGGHWVLRYAAADQEDKFGGSVVLAPTAEMKNFREGDLVCVSGQILDEGRASPALAAPMYRVDSINMVERADP